MTYTARKRAEAWLKSRRPRPSALLDRGRRNGPKGVAGLLQRVLLVVLGTLCGLVLFNNVLMPRVVRHGEDVRVPSVAGKELADAEAILRRSGLEPVRGQGRHHPGVPPGHVLELSPPVGLSVKKGRQVFLIPSIGAIDRIVPDVTGLSVRLARLRLTEAGLRIRKTDYAATEHTPADLVLAMSPEPGGPVPAHNSVTLLVSQKRAPVPYWLPDLRGREGRQSVRWLQANGFRASTSEGPPTGIPGTVVLQDPAPGTPVWPGARVALSVAPGQSSGRAFGRGLRW